MAWRPASSAPAWPHASSPSARFSRRFGHNAAHYRRMRHPCGCRRRSRRLSRRSHRLKATIRPGRGNLNSLRGLLTAQQQEGDRNETYHRNPGYRIRVIRPGIRPELFRRLERVYARQVDAWRQQWRSLSQHQRAPRNRSGWRRRRDVSRASQAPLEASLASWISPALQTFRNVSRQKKAQRNSEHPFFGERMLEVALFAADGAVIPDSRSYSGFQEAALPTCKTGNTIKQKGRHNRRRGAVYEKDHQEVTVMKVSILAVAAVIALAGPAFAQQLNGATLGQSQPGTNAGVPYPNPATADPAPAEPDPTPAATERTAPVAGSSVKQQAATPPKHHKKKTAAKKPPAPSAASTEAAAKPAPASPGASPPH
jgi:hypothetical protein